MSSTTGMAPRTRELRLDPRLLAKLMTESYYGTTNVQSNWQVTGEPPGSGPDQCPANCNSAYAAMAHNPQSIFDDPEFLALNPGFVPLQRPRARGAGRDVVQHSVPVRCHVGSDLVHQRRSGGTGLAQREARPLGHGGQPGLQGHPIAGRVVAAPRHDDQRPRLHRERQPVLRRSARKGKAQRSPIDR